MPDHSDSPATTVKQVASELRIAGWIGFWIQLVVAVVSSVSLLFTAVFLNRSVSTTANQAGLARGSGVFFAFCGLLALYAAVYWFFRYTRTSRQLQSKDTSRRPSRTETAKMLRLGLVINLLGMFLIILSAEIIVGLLFAKAGSLPQGTFPLNTDPRFLVSSFDIWEVLAILNAILAHFVGIVASLWLLSRVSR